MVWTGEKEASDGAAMEAAIMAILHHELTDGREPVATQNDLRRAARLVLDLLRRPEID